MINYKIKPYLDLIRFFQPTGVFLLLWPCLWSLMIASKNLPNIKYMIIFTIGAFIMRSAGCIINDLVDRNIDKHVERTKYRPIAANIISVKQAILLLGFLLLMASTLLLFLKTITIFYAFITLIPIILYPFIKRISYFPQLFLGLTFNLGILISWVEIRGSLDPIAIILYLSVAFLTLAYDTIYGFQDIKDDLKIGIKSTSILIQKNPLKYIRFFYLTFATLFITSCILAKVELFFYSLSLLPFCYLYYHIQILNISSKESCAIFFKSNANFSLMILVALMLSKVL